MFHSEAVHAVVFFFLCSCFGSVVADDRLPIPDKAAQKEAVDLVKEVFGKEIKAAQTPDQKLALTKKLLEQSSGTNDGPSVRYAMLQIALDIAPDASVAINIVDEIAKHFQIDSLNEKASTVWQMSKKARTSSQHVSVAETAMILMEDAARRDNYVHAIKLSDIALKAAEKAKDFRLVNTVRKKATEVSSNKGLYDSVQAMLATLEANPTDPKANGVVGKYRCFIRGDWQDGLPMLALSNNDELRELAASELKLPEQSTEQVMLADGWYLQAERANGETKNRMSRRAAHWYQMALRSQPILSGLVKTKVEKRIRDLSDFGKVDPPQKKEEGPFAHFAGTWTVRYQHGHGRQYVIDANGNVSFGAFRGKLSSMEKQIFLNIEDGKIERLRLDRAFLRVEHFNPASKFPNNPLRGVGKKLVKVDTVDFDALAGTWTFKYGNNAVRHYSIDKRGNAVFLNYSKTDTRRGRITLIDGYLILDFNDGKIERLHIHDNSLTTELFYAEDGYPYPHRIIWYGKGTRNG
jgi:hypothetical protein